MVLFSKFLSGQRNSTLLLDSDGYTYFRKKTGGTPYISAWRCSKARSLKCPCHVYLTTSDNSLSLGSKPHNHDSEANFEQKTEFMNTLKRKAVDQQVSATQDIVNEVIATVNSSKDLSLPKMESMNRVVQRARARIDINPAKKRRVSNDSEKLGKLFDICKSFGSYTDILEYLFDVAECSRHEDPTSTAA